MTSGERSKAIALDAVALSLLVKWTAASESDQDLERLVLEILVTSTEHGSMELIIAILGQASALATIAAADEGISVDAFMQRFSETATLARHSREFDDDDD